MTIGDRIQELRKKKYLSQEELAERLEVSKQSVSKWELNKVIPNVDKLIFLSELFEVSLDYLIKGEKEESLNGQENVFSQPDRDEITKKKTAEGSLYGPARLPVGAIVAFSVSCLVTFLLFLLMYRVVIVNLTGIAGSAEQEVAYVDHIYMQQTWADVVYVNDAGEFVTDTVYMDINGVRENDWIFCYPDGTNPRKFYMEISGVSRTIYITLFLLGAGVTIALGIRLWIRLKEKQCNEK